jgi:ketosteroid isomerase-like protein
VTDAETLAYLADRFAVCEVVLRYGRGVDRRDLDLVASCFTPDCAYEGTLASGTIADALAALPGRLARYVRTMHLMGTQDVRLDGDLAWCETACVAYHVLPDGGLSTVGVRYRDELVRGTDGWRIRRRSVERVWSA